MLKLHCSLVQLPTGGKDVMQPICYDAGNISIATRIANCRRPCKTSYVHETKFYRRDKKRSGGVDIRIYLLIFKYRSLNLLISVL